MTPTSNTLLASISALRSSLLVNRRCDDQTYSPLAAVGPIDPICAFSPARLAPRPAQAATANMAHDLITLMGGHGLGAVVRRVARTPQRGAKRPIRHAGFPPLCTCDPILSYCDLFDRCIE